MLVKNPIGNLDLKFRSSAASANLHGLYLEVMHYLPAEELCLFLPKVVLFVCELDRWFDLCSQPALRWCGSYWWNCAARIYLISIWPTIKGWSCIDDNTREQCYEQLLWYIIIFVLSNRSQICIYNLPEREVAGYQFLRNYKVDFSLTIHLFICLVWAYNIQVKRTENIAAIIEAFRRFLFNFIYWV